MTKNIETDDQLKHLVENALKAQGAKGVLTRCVAIFLNDGDIIRLEANSWEELLADAGGEVERESYDAKLMADEMTEHERIMGLVDAYAGVTGNTRKLEEAEADRERVSAAILQLLFETPSGKDADDER